MVVDWGSPVYLQRSAMIFLMEVKVDFEAARDKEYRCLWNLDKTLKNSISSQENEQWLTEQINAEFSLKAQIIRFKFSYFRKTCNIFISYWKIKTS